MSLDSAFEVVVNAQGFPVVVKKGEKLHRAAAAPVAEHFVRDHAKAREKTRLTKESGDRVEGVSGHIGGSFQPSENPAWLKDRAEVYDEIIAAQKARLAAKPRVPITVTLPDGKTVTGTSWETTPMSVAEGISKGLAQSIVVGKVAYTGPRVGVVEADGLGVVNTGPDEEEAAAGAAKAELWDLHRPLEGDCNLQLLKFEDKEGKMVFWHSSAHVLGECLECKYGAKLCIGPPTEEGFYYDAYMGSHAIEESRYDEIKKKAEDVCKAKQTFERIVLSKAQALRLFADNPFKVALISTKIPDGGYTTAYRCGPLIDLCRGPHVPNTGAIKAFEVTKNSSAYWLGSADNDSLQRVYGVSFPDAKQMKAYLTMVEEAKKRDHRLLGMKQELFFFHDLSPGSCFFLPHGAHIYNTLMAHIRSQYKLRGYHEVVTPNMFNLDLWRISGHADHYLENMFAFKVEGQDYGLKPMNCPGHCLMFDHRVRSYRELPWRVADFGVLHRNEFSGALTGLTRVRRFQQDDAHIFCRMDQIKQEVAGALDFMQHTYGIFGFTFELDLSTRPEKALGSVDLWHKAEGMMKEALGTFGMPWKINPGDGAFYGPKIDIKVFDALGRRHQCATIQLDFQLPIRFDLRYKSRTEADAKAETEEAEEGGAGGEEGAPPAAPPAAAPPAVPSAAGSAGEAGAAEAHVVKGGKGGGEKKEGKKDKKAALKEAAAAAAASHGSTAGGAHETGASSSAGPRSQVQLMVDRARSGVDDLPDGFERPVIIHRAILGSVERFMAVLIEHTGGKWPFWLSPRQIAIVPVALKYLDYAVAVRDKLRAAGLQAEVDASNHTLNKKVREAQVSQYNFILVVGSEEEAAGTVNIRTRDNQRHGTMPLADALAMFHKLTAEYQ